MTEINKKQYEPLHLFGKTEDKKRVKRLVSLLVLYNLKRIVISI